MMDERAHLEHQIDYCKRELAAKTRSASDQNFLGETLRMKERELARMDSGKGGWFARARTILRPERVQTPVASSAPSAEARAIADRMAKAASKSVGS